MLKHNTGTLLKNIFRIYKENGRIVVKIFALKMKFKNPKINHRLLDNCDIGNIDVLIRNNTTFVHSVGIVISENAVLGKNCRIFQNVTIGMGKYNPKNHRQTPVIGDDVTIYANAVVVGGINVGNNSVIGAGSIVIHDVPDNVTVAGNPAKIVHYGNA